MLLHASGMESSDVQSTAMYEAIFYFTSCIVGLFLSSVFKISPNTSVMAHFLIGGDALESSGSVLPGYDIIPVVSVTSPCSNSNIVAVIIVSN